MRQKIFIGLAIILSVLVLGKIVNQKSLAATQSYSDGLTGIGTNYNQVIPMDSELDSRSIRIPWIELEPTKDNYSFGKIFNLINDATSQNKKITIGIQLKARAEYSSNCTQSPCYDQSPPWAVDIDPLIRNTNNGQQHRMLNYVNPDVKTQIAELIGKLMSELATKYPDNNNYTILVCSGIDCEAQPEAELDQVYIDKWGNGNVNTAIWAWVDFVKWIVDIYEDKMNLSGLGNKTRYLVISANFENYRMEKPAYITHLNTKSNKWGLYSAGIAIGLKLYRYGEPHSTTEDQVLETNYDLQDILRRFCLNRPCLGEHGDAYEAGSQFETTQWIHWWRAASALWQRVDGYYTTKDWALTYGDLARTFFKDYWGKTYNTTPRAWVALHQDYRQDTKTGGYPQRNFAFYLDQFDTDSIDGKDARTTPEWSEIASGYDISQYNHPGDYRGIYTRRTKPGRIMAFRSIGDANGNFFIKDGPHAVKIRLVYLDHGNDSLSFKYSATNGTVKEGWKITKSNSNSWAEAEINLNDAMFSRQISNLADFYIDDNDDGDEYLHWVSVEYAPTQATPTPEYEGPFNGDANGDNVINLLDFEILRQGGADFNLDILRQNFGRTRL